MGGITPTTKGLLNGPLDPKHVKSREQGFNDVQYIEGWHAIAEANRIFGFDNWDVQIIDMKCVSEREREIGKKKYPGWGVSYTARVRVVVMFGTEEVAREGFGAGHGIDKDIGLAHESAGKEAATDALKRALMTFGNKFGLALYDKSRVNVRKDDGRSSKADARELATEITRLIKESKTVEELDDIWAAVVETHLNKLPEDWASQYTTKYEETREDLKAREP